MWPVAVLTQQLPRFAFYKTHAKDACLTTKYISNIERNLNGRLLPTHAALRCELNIYPKVEPSVPPPYGRLLPTNAELHGGLGNHIRIPNLSFPSHRSSTPLATRAGSGLRTPPCTCAARPQFPSPCWCSSCCFAVLGNEWEGEMGQMIKHQASRSLSGAICAENAGHHKHTDKQAGAVDINMNCLERTIYLSSGLRSQTLRQTVAHRA